MKYLLILSCSLLIASCVSDPSAACTEAAIEVDRCYGSTAANEFMLSCDEAMLARIDPIECDDPVGKADLLRDSWTCRNLNILCDRTEVFESDEEHFKYGSLGSEDPGLPVLLLRAIPEICPDLWPETGWAGYGMLEEEGHDLPIGWSIRRVAGIDFAAGNCARCHTSTVRDAPGAEPRIFFGGPGQQVDDTFASEVVLRCIEDDRFTGTRLAEVVSGFQDVGTVQRAALKLLGRGIKSAAGGTVDKLLPVISDERRSGPGRSDAFTLGAITLLDWPLEGLPFASSDFGVAWGAEAREGDLVNWDGNSDDIHESNLSVTLALGAKPQNIDHAGLERSEAFLNTLSAPDYPYAIDDALASVGQAIYSERCASCHERSGDFFMTVFTPDELNTDPERAKHSTPDFVEAVHQLGEGYEWQFSSFRTSDGYLAGRLDGAWLRAPYLHNGSVPTLRDLLSPEDERPSTFYRGGDVYDPVNVGFVSSEADQDGRELFLFDVQDAGQANTGHVFGTSLSDKDKDALIEYLKTI